VLDECPQSCAIDVISHATLEAQAPGDDRSRKCPVDLV
jgi:hypothetical protein